MHMNRHGKSCWATARLFDTMQHTMRNILLRGILWKSIRQDECFAFAFQFSSALICTHFYNTLINEHTTQTNAHQEPRRMKQ